MVLVDTSVWISHFRSSEKELARLLNNGQVFCHPFIVGELACGNMHHRKDTLELLNMLPTTALVTQGELMDFIERRTLAGKGIGYIDVHLLASAILTGAPLWTMDKRLLAVARHLKIDHH